FLSDDSPKTITYKITGIGAATVKLTHSVGLQLADNSFSVLAKKGDTLPLAVPGEFKTSKDIRSGNINDEILIPIYEGDNLEKADFNDRIGSILIRGDQLKRDIPKGSDVEIILNIDESRNTKTSVNIPQANFNSSKIFVIGHVELPNVKELNKEFDEAYRKFEENKLTVSSPLNDNIQAEEMIKNISDENVVGEIQELLTKCQDDNDAISECNSRILALKNYNDKLEKTLEFDKKLPEVKAMIYNLDDMILGLGEEDDIESFNMQKEKLNIIINDKNMDSLNLIDESIKNIAGKIYAKNTTTERRLKDRFEILSSKSNDSLDPLQFNNLLSNGKKAIIDKNYPLLTQIIDQLYNLLPNETNEIDEFDDILLTK
ncbi:MAG: hypothetical protein LBU40_03005, partial [Methanobrevibacter sp.]|nr:hypothetical protein [Methanobrevibacter sp.]